jgi:hypothetical protein
MAKPDKEVLELAELMKLTGVGASEASQAASMAQSNWSRWFNRGMSPTLAKFRKFRSAVIAIAVREDKLPDGCENKPVSALIDIARGWRV